MNVEQKRQLLIQVIQNLTPEKLEEWIEDNLDLYEAVYNAQHPETDEEGFDVGFGEEDEDEEDYEDEEGLEHDDDLGNGQDW